MSRCGVALAGLVLLVAPARPAPPIADADLDRHVQALAQELRCLVCQNQTLADSQADLALDLKRQVREQLAQGRSDEQVRDYLVQRYGDFVLYRPPVKGLTLALWFGPLALLLLGLVWLLKHLRAQATQADADPDASGAQS